MQETTADLTFYFGWLAADGESLGRGNRSNSNDWNYPEQSQLRIQAPRIHTACREVPGTGPAILRVEYHEIIEFTRSWRTLGRGHLRH